MVFSNKKEKKKDLLKKEPKIKKEKTKKVKKSKGKGLGNKKINFKLSMKSNIKGTLIKAFLVPIILIIILGVVSYITASKTIKNKVEESSENTISAMAMYFELLTSTVASKAQEMVMGNDMSSYYESYYKINDGMAMQCWRNAKEDLLQLKSSVSYLYSYNVIPENGISITSTAGSGSMSEGIYSKFAESAEGKYLADNGLRNAWLGYHSALDEDLKISPNQYGIAYFQKFFSVNTYLVLDITTGTIEEMLDEMDLARTVLRRWFLRMDVRLSAFQRKMEMLLCQGKPQYLVIRNFLQRAFRQVKQTAGTYAMMERRICMSIHRWENPELCFVDSFHRTILLRKSALSVICVLQ